MNLPNFTKNEKIFIFSSIVVTIIFWGGFLGYYLIKLDRIVNSETKPIDTSAYRLPTSSPTASLSPTLQLTIPTAILNHSQFTRFIDYEYNLSFYYPADLIIKKTSQQEKIKRYFLINSSITDSKQVLAYLYIIDQDYKEKAAELKALVKNIQRQNKTKETNPVFITKKFLDEQEMAIVKFPAPGETFYISAIYPLKSEQYLHLVIKPEFYFNYLVKYKKEEVFRIINQLIYSVGLLDNNEK